MQGSRDLPNIVVGYLLSHFGSKTACWVCFCSFTLCQWQATWYAAGLCAGQQPSRGHNSVSRQQAEFRIDKAIGMPKSHKTAGWARVGSSSITLGVLLADLVKYAGSTPTDVIVRFLVVSCCHSNMAHVSTQ